MINRDTGLLRAMGVWGLTASIVSSVVGASIFKIPGALALSAGIYAPLVIIVCALAVGAVAICFAEGGSRVPSSGGAYAYIQAAFGPRTGYVAGTLLWFGDVLACGAIAAALADLATPLIPVPLRALSHALMIIGVIGGIAFVNIGGVARGTRLVAATTLIKLLPLAVFIIVGASAFHASTYFQPTEVTTSGIGRAFILELFALTGMEAALCTSGEVREPAKTIPRALGLSMAFAALLYIAIQVIAQGMLGASLAQSTLPLADAMTGISPALRGLMLVGASLSMFGFISCDILCSPRILFAFARDGLLPRVLGRLHARSHAPHIAIICHAGIAIGLALSGTFNELAVLAALVTAGLYIAGCAAAWQLAHQGIALAGTALKFRWLRTASVVGIISMLLLIALASRAEILGLITLILVSLGVYWLQTRNLQPTPT